MKKTEHHSEAPNRLVQVYLNLLRNTVNELIIFREIDHAKSIFEILPPELKPLFFEFLDKTHHALEVYLEQKKIWPWRNLSAFRPHPQFVAQTIENILLNPEHMLREHIEAAPFSLKNEQLNKETIQKVRLYLWLSLMSADVESCLEVIDQFAQLHPEDKSTQNLLVIKLLDSLKPLIQLNWHARKSQTPYYQVIDQDYKH